jgi:aminoglycoside/choline kinase family phosphotransferase
MNDFLLDKIKNLFKTHTGSEVESIQSIMAAGSPRQYFRLRAKNHSIIGAYNADVKENETFFHYSEIFRSNALNTPEIFLISEDRQHYLLQDLGDQCLFDILIANKKQFTNEIKKHYQQALQSLIQFQTIKDLDYNYAYPREAFDRRSILWDLNYFKYYFLKMQTSPFDEEALENDFQKLADDLLEINGDYFMFRDFQARNIMIHNNKPWFIDYQGGRKGPLQYDVISLLFLAKAELSYSIREELLDFYIQEVQKSISIDVIRFKQEYDKVLLIRLLQVLGAYGFRGLIEKRPHFVESLSFGIKNIQWYLENVDYIREFPELYAQIKNLTVIS